MITRTVPVLVEEDKPPLIAPFPLNAVRPRPVFFYDSPQFDDRVIEARIDQIITNGYVIPPSPYPLLKSYNGASGQERRDGGNKWNVALWTKIIPRPKECSVCGNTKNVGAHNENYFRPLYAKPICRGCHMLLHKRFANPAPWLDRATRYRYAGAWFLNVSMRPLSRAQALKLAEFPDPTDARQLLPATPIPPLRRR